MYLRVTAFKSDPSKLEAGIAYLRDKVIPALSQVPGFVGGTCIVDREKSTGATSVLWESLEAMNNAEQIGQQARADSEEATGIEVLDVDRFEITTLEMTETTAKLPSFTRVITAYQKPERADQTTAVIRDKVIPKLKQQAGFRAFASGINRMTGRGFTSSSWATADQREASNAAVADLRQTIVDSGGMYGLQVTNVETVIAEVKLPARA